MMKNLSLDELSGYSITTGVVLDPEFMAVIFSNDQRLEKDPEDHHCYFGIYDSEDWWLYDFVYPITSQDIIQTPSVAVISISAIGKVRRTDPMEGGVDEANVGEASGLRVLGRSQLFEIRVIDGLAYVVGTRRAVYRRISQDVWECVDKDCYAPKDFTVGFQSIHGFSHSEIYAVGMKGEIWEFNGTNWQQHDSGTNVTLHKVLCAEDGYVYAVGKQGTIIKGRHNQWAFLEEIPSGYEFWSIASYNRNIYLTANSQLVFELLPSGAIQLVNFDECPIPSSAYHLTVGCDGCLYCFGYKDIRKYNGDIWEEVLTL